MRQGFAIVIDIGKTLSKVSLWSRDGRILDRVTRPNSPVEVDGTNRLDATGIAQFVLDALARLGSESVNYIVPVAHGAGLAALAGGRLVTLPLDYEQPLPPDLLAEYRASRAPFAETGSPALPQGLNLGAQAFWLDRLHPQAMARATLLPWAQYWAWLLTGEARSEVTSLGCHSDLWNPGGACYSSLAERMGWASRFAPMARAAEPVGTLTPAIAAQTGLSTTVKVLAGLHDSNAALLAARGFAEIADNEATVLSTGTWFIAMRLAHEALDLRALPEARDCLVNVDAYGQPVPSARFMGGREIESLIEIDTRRVDITPDQPHLLAAVDHLRQSGAMVLPTLAPGTGPFPAAIGGWVRRPVDWFSRRAGACLYAALMADCALDLIGSRERLLVEGRFAEAQVFVRALAALRPGTQVFTANAHNDVSFGALRLIDPDLAPDGDLVRIEPLAEDLGPYKKQWHSCLSTATP